MNARNRRCADGLARRARFALLAAAYLIPGLLRAEAVIAAEVPRNRPPHWEPAEMERTLEISPAATCAGTVGQGTFVSSRFFGMHVEQQFDVGWPTAAFATQRIWDVYPAVSWAALNPAQGRYDWVPLDRLVEDSRRRGVDLVYVFGAVPRWASSEPDGPCGTAPAGSCRPPDPAAWRDFIARITVRYGGKIQYWELWNEPDVQNFWAGTPDQLVALARDAHPLIKASGGTVLSPAPQGRNGPLWMESYLRAGGTPYADVNAFHAYLHDAPEALNELVRAYRALFLRFGIAGRPLWDTEHSWGEANAPFGGDPGLQAAWLARFFILSVHNRIDRSIWYGWHHSGWGTLYDKASRRLLEPGIAYGQVYRWLHHTVVGPCHAEEGVYRCPIQSAAAQARAGANLTVWSTRGKREITVPPGFTRYRRLNGTLEATRPGTTVTVGAKPILLER